MQKNELAQRLTQLKDREQKTRDNEIRLRAQMESIQAELAKAKQQAIDEFGTDDLETLRNKFKKAKEEDQKAIQAYEETLLLREQLIDTITANVDSVRLG